MDGEIILTLAVALIQERMKRKGVEYGKLLKQEKIKNEELGALTAGYKRALDDLDNVLKGINEIG